MRLKTSQGRSNSPMLDERTIHEQNARIGAAEEPGMVGSPERTRQRYGRVLPIHIERAGQRADALVD
jgi:hypothetical protein